MPTESDKITVIISRSSPVCSILEKNEMKKLRVSQRQYNANPHSMQYEKRTNKWDVDVEVAEECIR